MSAALSPQAQALIKAAADLIAHDGAGFMAAISRRDWKTVALDVVTAELTLAAAVPGPQQFACGLALQLLPVAVTLAAHATAHNSGEGGIGAAPEGNSSVQI